MPDLESHIGYNTGLTGANVDTAQSVTDRGERDRALADRDAALAISAEIGRKLETALAEQAELQRKFNQLTSERDADVNRQHEIAKDLRTRLDWAEAKLSSAPVGTFAEPQALDRIAPSAVQKEDAEREHKERDRQAEYDARAAEAEAALKADQEQLEASRVEQEQGDALHVPETKSKPPKKSRW